MIKKLTLSIASLLFFLLITQMALAQTGTIRGFVYEKKTGEPVIFTNVYLERSTYGAATDVNGYFVINQIPEGNYNLLVTYMGYDTLRMNINIASDQIIFKKLYLEESSVLLDVVNISAEREEAQTETRTSVVKLTPKQLSKIPTIGGQPDLAQYLQVLPGVVFTGDQGGQLYIRGGAPVQNLVLLDGMVVYNPFHSIGLFSVFDTDILRNADVYTGGFNAEYGGRISSVMDLTTRDGNKKRISGQVGTNTFGSKIMIEGPLKKAKDDNDNDISFIFSAKNSYLEQSSKLFYEYADTAGLPFNFTDIYSKISFNTANGSKFNIFGFNFNDEVNNYKSLNNFKWNSSGAGMNFIVIPGKSPVLLEGHLAYSKYKILMEEVATLSNNERSSNVNNFNIGLGFTYFQGKDELKYGLDILAATTDFRFYNSINREIAQVDNTTEFAGYVKYKKNFNKIIIEPGVRLQLYSSLGNIRLEPRLAMKYNIKKNIRLKMAGGFYSQNLISSTSDKDVVNLFNGYISGPENLPSKFDGADVSHKLQTSRHLIGGVEFDLSHHITANIEGYYKGFPQLTNLNRNKLYNDDASNLTIPDYQKKDFIIEKGDAKGIDLSIKYEDRRVYFWMAYSFSYVNRSYETTEMIEYAPHYDRRHNLNLVSSVKLGSEKNWEISARWNLGSGFPFTQNQGIYEQIGFNSGINSQYWNENGTMSLLYAGLNEGRMPYYHRLDLNVKYKKELGEYSSIQVDAGVTNAYNRNNLFYIDRITQERVDQLPIMPSLGITFKF